MAKKIRFGGGREPTINRVGDIFFDQGDISGYYNRPDDLDLIVSLGIHLLRHDVLWERVAPHDQGQLEGANWDFDDAQMRRLKRLEVDEIILGLVHHGSGPRATGLMQDTFPIWLANYAEAVARRYSDGHLYPRIKRFTIVNEPGTTARFSGLYGFWYPHERSSRAFVRALYNQCLGTALAMARIRKHIPDAELVQTEDIGHRFSTLALADQADFENERQWLTFDLLTGKVDRTHPFWNHFIENGVTAQELDYFLEYPCPPAVIGVNYYVTSDRYFDERIECFPAHCIGSNGKIRYADVEAVRVANAKPIGHKEVLLRAYARYGIPVALTEVKLACREEIETLRWQLQGLQGAHDAQAAGAEVDSVFAWALTGAWNWDKCLTINSGSYEAGAFDLQGDSRNQLVLTELGRLITCLAKAQDTSHFPGLRDPGWWQRDDIRVIHDIESRESLIPPSP